MRHWPANYLMFDQGSPEWLHERCGSVTASRVKAVMARGKNGQEAAVRHSYKMELLMEVLTGQTAEHYVSMAMDFGIENEPLARAQYELATGVEVERIGYVRHPHIPRSGASPDGLVGDDGLIEIKVPNTTTHLEYLLAGEVPAEYRPQMMWQLACTDRQWCDFVSYDPRLPHEFGLLIVRMERDEKEIAAMEAAVREFIGELNAMCEKLQSLRPVEGESAGPPRAVIPSEL
jgi:putative phage-type endonuclease